MELSTGRCGELIANLEIGSYNGIKDLRNAVSRAISANEAVVSTSAVSSEFYLLHNGKILNDDSQILEIGSKGETSTISVIPRILGGKGGFGSMLRAIGAQIEKTTNRDACRDLSGRRLRDIHEERRLKSWYAKSAEREEARKEAKKEKLRKLKNFADGPALPKIEDQEFLQRREDLEEAVYEAVDEAFKGASEEIQKGHSTYDAASSSTSTAEPSTSTNDETSSTSTASNQSVASLEPSASDNDASIATKNPKKKKKGLKSTFGFDEDLGSDDSDEEEDHDDEEEATPGKKAKMN